MPAPSQPAASGETPSFFGAACAVAVGITMLAGFSIIAALSALDRQNRGALEKWEEVTGVEDRSYFTMPAKVDPARFPAVKLEGSPLYLESREILGIHDSDVRKVAKDSETGLTIYRAADPKAAHLSGSGEVYLLKTESGRYVKLKSMRES